MLVELKATDLFNTGNIVGIFILLSIFPFIFKSFIVYLKIEREEEGEKLIATKYYQLLTLELIIFICFLICNWRLALPLSVIFACIIFLANRILVKKHVKQTLIKENLKSSIKLKEILIAFILSIFEGIAVNLLFI